MANGMTGLYIGASGITSAQNALNATAHNLANINTEGYTRQQVSLGSAEYFKIGNSATMEQAYGMGVDTLAIRRVRDELIDKAYRQESGRYSYYSAQYDAVLEIEDLFGEMQGVTFQESMLSLKDAITQLAYEPESTIKRGALIQMASNFIDRANAIYQGMRDYQSTLNTKVSNMVTRINELADSIYTLNKEISKIELAGEHANDLRDQRDSALDELGGYIKIQYQERSDGIVTVTAEGIPLVTENYTNKMDTEMIEGTQLLRPIWPSFQNRSVFNDYEEVTAINNNDIGELKGLLIARGNRAVDYEDVPVEPEAADYAGGATDPQYLADMAQYAADCDYYNKFIDNSVILSTMASFDKLINGIVTSLNDILCPNKEMTIETDAKITDSFGNEIPGYEKVDDGAGNITYKYTLSVLDVDSSGVGMDKDKTVGVELFARQNTDRYVEWTNPKTGETLHIYNTQNEFGVESKYTLGNIVINSDAAQHVDWIPLSSPIDEGEDFDRAGDMLDAWDVKFAALNPAKYAKEDFDSFYNSLIAEFATTGEVLHDITSAQQTMRDGYDAQRLRTEGVASDEELQNMIKYQQAYNAASRYINVVNEMLEHIVTRLGNQ